MTNPNPSPLSFLPVMLAAWRVLCDAEFPLSLTGVEMRLVPELNWLALDQPARQLLEKALRALTALELVEQRGANFTRLARAAQEEALSFKSQEEEELIKSSSCLTSAGTPATRAAEPPAVDHSETIAALKEAGVLPHVRRELLQAFPGLSSDDVSDMEKYLKKHFRDQYSPGLLVYRLRLGERAPDENRMSREMRDFLTCNNCGEINCACGWNLDDEQPDEESAEYAVEESA